MNNNKKKKHGYNFAIVWKGYCNILIKTTLSKMRLFP